MANEQPNTPQVQSQIQALADEIWSIRDAFGPATTELNRLRTEVSRLNAAAIGNDNYIASLVQRLQHAEFAQQRLLAQVTNASAQTEGQTAGMVTYGGPGYGGGPLAFTCIGYGSNIPPPPRPSMPSVYNASPSRGPPPFSDPISASAPRASSVYLSPTPGQPQQHNEPSGSKDNANYLPMVIENLAMAKEDSIREKKQGACYFILEKQGSKVKKCKRPTYAIKCFQEGHFHYCRRHMRIIPADESSCSPIGRSDCVPTYWEWREDWETIVDQAFQAGNLGKKNLTPDELKQALFPPFLFPHRYL